MARILVTGPSAHGLVNPVLPLVAALGAAGHAVDVALHPAFRVRVERAGATLLPAAAMLDGPLTSPRQLLRHGRAMFAEMARTMRRLGPGYDIVIGAGMQPDLPAVERALNRPVAFASPVFFQNDRTARHFARICTGMPAPGRRVLATPALRRVAGRVVGAAVFGHDVGDVVTLMGQRSSTLNLTVASREYQPFPDDFPGAVFMGPTPTQKLPDPSFPLDRLREHSGPVVYGTLGTVFNSWIPFFRTLADAFARSDALVVLTTGGEDGVRLLGKVPDNVILRPFVPQTEVLEHADVCFTHGGFGTATDAVCLGVPLVVTPLGADQFFNAYRLAELGAAQVLAKADFTVDAVLRAADAALNDAAGRAGRERLAASFSAAGGAAAGVRAIEAIL